MAVSVAGIRICQIMYVQAGFVASSPANIDKTSKAGIATDPDRIVSAAAPKTNKIRIINKNFRFIAFLILLSVRT